MKSIIVRLTLVLAAFAVVPNALAADTSSGNFFLGASLGETFGGAGSSHSGYASDSQGTFSLGGGYLWKIDEANSEGFDVGYMDFGTVAPDDPSPFSTGQASVTGLMAGVHYEHLYGIDKTWVFQARLGLMSASFDEKFSNSIPGGPKTSGSRSSNETGEYLGLGIGRQLTQAFSVILAYNYYASGKSNGFGLNQSGIALEAEVKF